MNRRNFLGAGLGIAATSLLPGTATAQDGIGQTRAASSKPELIGRRKLGKLEVSAVGLGVQNMTRRYETTVPDRPEMIHIIRTAFDRSVTFFDAAEAYGPHEVERLLGEAVTPFRDKIQIATKFGGRHSWHRVTILARKRPSQPGARGTGENLGQTEANRSRSDCPGMVDGAEALDRADSWNDADGSHVPEQRLSGNSFHAIRTRGVEFGCQRDRGERSASAGCSAGLLRRGGTAEAKLSKAVINELESLS